MKGIFESTEVDIPTSFVIMPYNILKEKKKKEELEKGKMKEKAKQNALEFGNKAKGFFKWMGNISTSINEDEDFVAASETALNGKTALLIVSIYILSKSLSYYACMRPHIVGCIFILPIHTSSSSIYLSLFLMNVLMHPCISVHYCLLKSSFYKYFPFRCPIEF